MTNAVEWGVPRRIAFRFAVIFAGLLMFPFPIYVIPKSDDLSTALSKPLEWATQWFATSVLGLPRLAAETTGSGDRMFDYVQLLLFALCAAIGTMVWSIIDRRRRSYTKLAALAWVVLRYFLAWTMLRYGELKVIKSQFPDLSPSTLHQRLSEIPPMRLVWSFIGYSVPYTVFAGLSEMIGGVLLLWRRTATLGALLVIPVMTNVVMLNFCYDVPVKLFSTELLVMAVVIAWPQLRRLIGAVLGRAAVEVPPRPRMSRARERARLSVKLALLAVMAANLALDVASQRNHADHVHELYGLWTVDRFVSDGVEPAKLVDDPVRWESWSASTSYARIWLLDGLPEGRAEPSLGWYALKVDPVAHTITLTPEAPGAGKEVWSYTRPAPDRLVIDCVHRGKRLHVTLHLAPEGRLLSRGFHWVNEEPFNL